VGRRGEFPVTPAPGYSWRETPQLNETIVKESRDEPYSSLCERLQQAYTRIHQTIDALSDQELFEPNVFEWAGKTPIARWISINTARQYDTARKYIRRARQAAT
ncbi:MAG: ClbS/DfsB family four-helix bundle protein, partial [Pseudomonadota bacterium]